jgi:hypothetical protein
MQAPMGRGKYSSYSFLISALDRCEWSASLPGRDLPPGKDPLYLLDRRMVGPQSWSDTEEKLFSAAGDRTPVVQYVVRQYTEWGTPAP